jgi:hypothetical protein
MDGSMSPVGISQRPQKSSPPSYDISSGPTSGDQRMWSDMGGIFCGGAGLAGGGPGRWGHSVCHHRQLRGVVADGPLRAPGSGAPAIAKVAPRTARAAGRATSHPPGILPNTDPRHRALLGKGGTGLNGHAPGTRVERPSGKPFPFTRPRPRPGSLPPARSHGAGAREPQALNRYAYVYNNPTIRCATRIPWGTARGASRQA